MDAAAAAAAPPLPADTSAAAVEPRDVTVFYDQLEIKSYRFSLPASHELAYPSLSVSDSDVFAFLQLVKEAGHQFTHTLYPLVLLRIALSHEYAWLALRRAWAELWRVSFSGIIMRFVANRFARLKHTYALHIREPSVAFGVLHGICIDCGQTTYSGVVTNSWTVFLMEFGDLAPTAFFGLPAAVQVCERTQGYHVRLVWNQTKQTNTEIIQFLIRTDDPPKTNFREVLNPAHHRFSCEECGLAFPDRIVVSTTSRVTGHGVTSHPMLQVRSCVKCEGAITHARLPAHFLDVQNLTERALVGMYESLIQPQSDDNNSDKACYPLRAATQAYADLGNASFPAPWYTALRDRACERKHQDELYGPPKRQDPRDVLDFIKCSKSEWRSPLETARPTKRVTLDFTRP